ncbi:cardioexcitatory receptor [Elysia marginata]|uniref:Cardioexcitatory receptor n=1 Tax=Elysia marginata TaxID=1093978 RepID=A0AAV4G6Q5_9GAST|nr:cardioexcitatory receptor [Elysia marginata]
MMLQYFVPLAVITVTNCHIGYIVWIKKTPGEAEADRDRRMAASKRRLVKMIIIVVVIYAVCFLPLHVITVVGDHNPAIYSLPHMNVVWLCAHWLAMSHSCYNPIVYFSLNTTFRHNLKRMMLICRTSVRRHYRNRKRRGRQAYSSNGNRMGSASSLQHNGGLGTGGTSGGGDWTITADMDEEETEFVDSFADSTRNGINRNPRISTSIRSGTGGTYVIRGSMISNSDWKHMTNMSRKSRKKDMYM